MRMSSDSKEKLVLDLNPFALRRHPQQFLSDSISALKTVMAEPGPSAPQTATITEIEGGDEGGYDGNLPNFDDEPSLTTPAPKVPVRIMTKTSGGPPRKKIPPATAAKKKVAPVAKPAPTNKDKAKAVMPDDDEGGSSEVTGGQKEPGLSDEMLDRVMAQLLVEQGPEVAGTLQRKDVAKAILESGISTRLVASSEIANKPKTMA